MNREAAGSSSAFGKNSLLASPHGGFASACEQGLTPSSQGSHSRSSPAFPGCFLQAGSCAGGYSLLPSGGEYWVLDAARVVLQSPANEGTLSLALKGHPLVLLKASPPRASGAQPT